MGNLLRVLYNRDHDSLTRVDIFVDFENCKPTESEESVWIQVNKILDLTSGILEQLKHYRGATEEIRQAISNPNDTTSQGTAWQRVVSLVSQLKTFYEFSLDIEAIIPQLLGVLCSKEMTPKQHLETQQALFKQFAQVLDFTLTFDSLKSLNPAIQNDFSYYRRSLSRMRMSSSEEMTQQEEYDVTATVANRMSLFYAQPAPMLRVVSEATSRFVAENKDLPIENTTECLSTMASICRVMVENPTYRSKFQSEETVMFCLRVMVGVIVLFDHVHPVGAFVKSSNIDMKNSIKILKEQPAEKTDILLNVLRYTTKHLNDDNTPKAIKNMLIA